MAAKTWSRTVGDANWSTAANWSGGTVPVNADTVTFDATSVLDCNIDNLGTFNDNITVAATYSGIITQSINISVGPVSIAGGTWTKTTQTFTCTTFGVSGGVFNGGSGTMATGAVTFSGGNLTATSSTWTITSASFTQTNTPTFNANGGTIEFDGVTAATLNAPNITFNLIFPNKTNARFTVAASTTCPLGANPETFTTSVDITNNGTITVSGDWIQHGGFVNGATGTVSGALTSMTVERSPLTLNAAGTFPANVAFTLSLLENMTVTATAYTFTTVVLSIGSPHNGFTLTIAAGTTIPITATQGDGATGGPGVTVSGTLSIAANVILVCSQNCTFNSGSTFSGPGVLRHHAGTLTVNAGATVSNSPGIWFHIGSALTTGRVFAGGGKTYGFLRRTGASGATASLTITGTNTFGYLDDTEGVDAHSWVFPNVTTTLTDKDPFRMQGSAGNLLTLARTGGAGTFTLTATASGARIYYTNYISVSNSTVDASPVWYAGAQSTVGAGTTNWVAGNSGKLRHPAMKVFR